MGRAPRFVRVDLKTQKRKFMARRTLMSFLVERWGGRHTPESIVAQIEDGYPHSTESHRYEIEGEHGG